MPSSLNKPFCILDLPDEVLLKIADHLKDPIDRKNLSLTCKRFYNVMGDKLAVLEYLADVETFSKSTMSKESRVLSEEQRKWLLANLKNIPDSYAKHATRRILQLAESNSRASDQAKKIKKILESLYMWNLDNRYLGLATAVTLINAFTRYLDYKATKGNIPLFVLTVSFACFAYFITAFLLKSYFQAESPEKIFAKEHQANISSDRKLTSIPLFAMAKRQPRLTSEPKPSSSNASSDLNDVGPKKQR